MEFVELFKSEESLNILPIMCACYKKNRGEAEL